MSPSDDAVRRAFHFSGNVVARHQLGSVPVLFFVDLAQDEIRRRSIANMGAIVDRRVVNALWEVPADIDYPGDALPRWVVQRLQHVNGVDVSGTVRRTVRPPVVIRGAATVGRSLPRLLDALGPLSSVCPTAVVLVGDPPRPDDEALLDAQLFGVAVGRLRGGEIEVLTQAQPVRREVGAYQWHVAEMVYSQIARVS